MSSPHKTDSCCQDDHGDGQLDKKHENRPGLGTLSYRLGRHSDFFQRMLSRLPRQSIQLDEVELTPLSRLTYQGTDDASIAVLDACAALLDVLSFYQERVANESYVRTARERLSVQELVRSIGYEMRPGVAASTLLAFAADSSDDSPEVITVPTGTQVLSIPKKGELPKTFETVEDIDARAEWNALSLLPPFETYEQEIRADSSVIFLKRSGVRPQPGDLLLLVESSCVTSESSDPCASDEYCVRKVSSVLDIKERGYLRVALQDEGSHGHIFQKPRVYAFRGQSRLFGSNAAEPVGSYVIEESILAPDFVVGRPVASMAVSVNHLLATGHEAMSGSSTEQTEYSTLRIWDPASETLMETFDYSETVTAMTFSPDAAYLVSGSRSGDLVIWDMSSGKVILQDTHSKDNVSRAINMIQFGLMDPTDPIVDADGDENTTDDQKKVIIPNIFVYSEDGLVTKWRFYPDESEPTLERLGEEMISGFTTSSLKMLDGERELEGRSDGTVLSRNRLFTTPELLPDVISITDGRLALDRIRRKVIPGSWALVQQPGRANAYRIESVGVELREDYGLSRRVTVLGLEAETDITVSRRETDIYTESIELEIEHPRLALPIRAARLQGTEWNTMRADLSGLDEDAQQALSGRTVIIEGRVARQWSPPEKPCQDEPEYVFTATALDERGTEVVIHVKPDLEECQEDPTQEPTQWFMEDDHGWRYNFSGVTPSLVAWDSDEVVREIVTISGVDDGQLKFVESVQNIYDWRSVRILANVAKATHGETIDEVLGSGEGLLINQMFRLKKPPLTHTSAANERGYDSSLQVRVNGVLWEESESLLLGRPDEETFIVRIQDNGRTEITFGDGIRGARLPSGAENIVARYRSGTGPDGELDAGQLALLKTRPMGITDVINPFPATGSAAQETRDEAGEKAPRTVLILGRVVSVQDYEDFAKSYPGVGKAKAVAMWDGVSKFTHLTVGTESGRSIETGSPLYTNLLGALDAVRNTNQLLVIDGYTEKRFGLEASLIIDQRYEIAPVVAHARVLLAEAFSYSKRGFGQDVSASEIVAVLQATPGVVAVDLDNLYFTTPTQTENPPTPDGDGIEFEQLLEASPARLNVDGPEPAELLLIDDDPQRIVLEGRQ